MHPIHVSVGQTERFFARQNLRYPTYSWDRRPQLVAAELITIRYSNLYGPTETIF